MRKIVKEDVYNSGEYLQNHPNWHVEDSLWKSQQILQMLRKHNIVPKKVIEIGSGVGEILKCLSLEMKDAMFVGYEVAEAAHVQAMKRSGKNLKFILDDISKVENDADVALIIDVFEHVDDYIGFIRNTKTRGTFKIFHIPLDISILNVVRPNLLSTKRSHSGHLHYFHKNSALDTLNYCGMEVVDWVYTKGFELPGDGWLNRALNIVRSASFKITPDFAVRSLGGCSLLVICK
jgi:hypothetical protein